MHPSRRDVSALVFAAAAAPGVARAQARKALVIARGGGDGDAPPATRGAYDRAIKDGADFLAANLVVSRDGVVIVRRDSELSTDTDIAGRPQFAARRTSKTIGGAPRVGWFAEDFDLAELKSLICGPATARRSRDQGPPSIATLRDVVETARAGCVRTGRTIGVYAILPPSAYWAALNLSVEPRLAETIVRGGYNTPAAAMIVASPEPSALQTVARLTRVRRVLRTEAALTVDLAADLAAVRAHAHGVAPDLSHIVDVAAPKRPAATSFIARAHAAGLFVHAWAAPDDSAAMMQAAYDAAADGICADLARPAAKARARMASNSPQT